LVALVPRGEVLRIRCSKETIREWKVYVAEAGFRTYEDALRFLLRKARELSLKPESWL